MSQANRGRAFEQLIEQANEQYATKNWAHVTKIPNHWVVIRKGRQITSAFPSKKSPIDFIGLSNGRFIAFDAKSTQERTRFPLSNIESHQMDYMQHVTEHGGQAFILLEYAKLQEIYLIPYKDLQKYWEDAENGGRKSIPYADMWQFNQVKTSRGIVLDYLEELV